MRTQLPQTRYPVADNLDLITLEDQQLEKDFMVVRTMDKSSIEAPKVTILLVTKDEKPTSQRVDAW